MILEDNSISSPTNFWGFKLHLLKPMYMHQISTLDNQFIEQILVVSMHITKRD